MNRKSFLQLFLSILAILFLVFFLTLFALRPVITFYDLWGRTGAHLPVIFYIGIILVVLALLLTWFIHSSLSRSTRKIREKLHWLFRGNYSMAIFFPEVNRSLILDEYEKSVNEEIELLRSKMIQLSREIQDLSARPAYLNGETKEEILEKERHRLARELHDSVSQQLFAAMMILSAMNEKAESLPPQLQKQLQLIETIVNESQSEMRALLLHLRPVKLEGKSLKKGIDQLLQEIRTKVQIKVKADVEEVRTRAGVEDHLFRIVQELLSNTLRHAKAEHLEVYLHQSGTEMSLRVVDDGVGFDAAQTKSGSYGLMNIKERVNGLGGTCKIISFPQKGTVVEIRIPNT